MKKFTFRLESVLTLRAWEEERAHTAHGQALRQESRFATALREIDGRIENEIAAWRQAEDATVSPADRAGRWRHLLTLDRERADTAQKLASARRIREQKMKLLLDAHRRVEVLATLKKKRHEAHLAESRRREEREIDDLVSARTRTVHP